MEGLPTLIRLHKNDLDQMRRTLAELEAQRDKFLDAIKRLDEELENEKMLSTDNLTIRRFFSAFAKNNRSARATIEQAVKRVDTQITQQQNRIFEKFKELKKFEIAQADIEEEALQESLRQEQAELNAIGLEGYIRKKEEQK